jgi:hypothetical protein
LFDETNEEILNLSAEKNTTMIDPRCRNNSSAVGKSAFHKLGQQISKITICHEGLDENRKIGRLVIIDGRKGRDSKGDNVCH